MLLPLVLGACGGPARSVQAPVTPGEAAPPSFDDERGWAKFHSKRMQLTVPLPDGHAWRIDDHARPELVAEHAATRSRLVVRALAENDLVNRQACEARARDLGLVPPGRLETVDDQTTVGPEAFDTRVWVALEPGPTPEAPLRGHVLAFGGHVRRCLVFHFATEVASSREEDMLSTRLAVARVKVLGGIALDPPRTSEDAVVPRIRPGAK